VVAKLTPDFQLSALAMFGGASSDSFDGIGVDARGRVFCSGTTQSTDFPVTANAFQSTHAGGNDAVALVLDNDLDTLLYSTFIGGSNYDLFRGSYIDAKGTLYGTGAAVSTIFPTVNADDSTYGGSNDPRWGNGDAILVKFTDANLYLGDSDQDLLPDSWEIANYGSLNQDAESDLDGDGNSARLELLHGTDPNDSHSKIYAHLIDPDTLQFSPSSALVDYQIRWSYDLSTPVDQWSLLELSPSTSAANGTFDLTGINNQFDLSVTGSVFFTVAAKPLF